MEKSPDSSLPLKLSMVIGLPPDTELEALIRSWVDKIHNDTNNRVKISIIPPSFPGGASGGIPGWDDVIAKDPPDIMCYNPGLDAPHFPIASSIPWFAFGTDLTAARKARNELWNQFPELQAEFNGVKVLFGHGVFGSCISTTKKPVRTLEDLQGLTIVPLVGFPGVLNKLGAMETDVHFMQIYADLEKGIVDGAMNPSEVLKSFNYYKVTRYSLYVPLAFSPAGDFFAMKEEPWNRLPPDIKKAFEYSTPWMETELDRTLIALERKAIDFVKSQGHEFFELSREEIKSFFSIWEEKAFAIAADLDAKGLPGTKIFKETRRLMEKHSN